ncbi:GNAT family N-acetyltransferase [Acidaminobacter sp. JC074]|uniref:GNAT family N-acetyltransferase n=1 Tax=Acidaminobacter sp. JC074 TaxID=2530199 RepID=UPI001F1069CB|nr:GNAT family N-acetyltransferase [Acidaminobacter sp. JC074]MCH4886013.1 GNAT family N-acetyltransferase [Acidaminobacter sp. JC074]
MIRLLNMDDYEAVYDLWSKTAGMGLRSLDDSYEGIERFLKRNPQTNFVYEKDGKIVGVILCGNDGRRAYIYHATVDTNYRGCGIGKQLVDKVIAALKIIGINKVSLVVFKDNEIGNGFWESIGFKNRNDLIYRDLMIESQNI